MQSNPSPAGEKRVIKFRAWQKAHNKMHYKVNLYSLSGDKITRAQLDNKSFMDTIGFTCEIMQFTCLQDISFKDCYEGDIVKAVWSEDINDELSGVGIVEFVCGCFMIQWIDDPEANMELLGLLYKTGRPRVFKILGNIYEHPNLLTPQTPPNEQ